MIGAFSDLPRCDRPNGTPSKTSTSPSASSGHGPAPRPSLPLSATHRSSRPASAALGRPGLQLRPAEVGGEPVAAVGHHVRGHAERQPHLGVRAVAVHPGGHRVDELSAVLEEPVQRRDAQVREGLGDHPLVHPRVGVVPVRAAPGSRRPVCCPGPRTRRRRASRPRQPATIGTSTGQPPSGRRRALVQAASQGHISPRGIIRVDEPQHRAQPHRPASARSQAVDEHRRSEPTGLASRRGSAPAPPAGPRCHRPSEPRGRRRAGRRR